MDEDLKLYLDKKFAEVDRRFSEVDRQFAEVHKKFADVDRQFAEVHKKFADVDRHFSEIDRQFEEERVALRQTETNLLTAFHNWARTYEVKERTLSNTVRSFDERLGLIEDRVVELERKTYQKAS